MGKTRLLREFQRSLAGGEAIWLEAACLSTNRDAPYALLGAILGRMFDLHPGDEASTVEEKVLRRLGELSPLQGVDDPQLASVLKETLGLSNVSLPVEERRARRGRLVHLLRTLMANVAQTRPLFIAIDDMHWIDDASLEVLVQVTDGIDRLPVQLALLYRPEWRHPWFEKPYYRHLALEQLDEAGRVELLGVLLETEQLPQGFAPILSAAGGNPFFMEEIVRSLQESGVLARREDGAPATGGWELVQTLTEAHLPETVDRTLRARLDRLSPDSRRLMQAAAVIGPGFSGGLLASLLSVPAPTVAEQLAELVERDFVLSTWGEADYHFRHALVLDVAYASLPGEQRQALHRRLAETLEAERADPRPATESLAHHRYHSLVVSRPGEAVRLDVQADGKEVEAALTALQQSGGAAWIATLRARRSPTSAAVWMWPACCPTTRPMSRARPLSRAWATHTTSWASSTPHTAS